MASVMSGEQLKQDGSGDKAQTLNLEIWSPASPQQPSALLQSYLQTPKYIRSGGRVYVIIAVPNFHLSPLFKNHAGLPGGPVIRNLPANAGNKGSIPGPGRFHMLRGSN